MRPFDKKTIYLFILLLMLNSLAVLALYRQNNEASSKIVFFNIGQGDAIFIEDENSNQILIDGGDGRMILDKLGKFMPFYDRKIELVIMTHPDKDHMGGLVEVLKYYDIGEILEAGIACDTAICKEWDALIKEKNVSVRYASFGQIIRLENGIDIKVIYPYENLKGKKISDDNDSSVIVKIFAPNGSYLLMGDAGFKLEKELLNKNIDLGSDILKISHHGSKNATSAEFLQEVRPEKAIISVGKNSYGHPTIEILNRLTNISAEILRTDEVGDLVFRLD